MTKKEKITTLLKGIETGDPAAAEIVNERKYIQHNPLTKEGNIGLAELFKRLSKTNPRVEIVRVFEDGDFVFAHTDYDFNTRDIGFEVFRFEDGFAVEHWDNLQLKPEGANLSGRTMIDGTVEIRDIDKTEENRKLVSSFVDTVLIQGEIEKLDVFIADNYIEHNPSMADGRSGLKAWLSADGAQKRSYETLHRVLAEGNFVLSVCEGFLGEVHTSFYDLFRVESGKIVEHWDTIEAVPHRDEWVNQNGKF